MKDNVNFPIGSIVLLDKIDKEFEYDRKEAKTHGVNTRRKFTCE